MYDYDSRLFCLIWNERMKDLKMSEKHCIIGDEKSLTSVRSGLNMFPIHNNFKVFDIKSPEEKFDLTENGIIRKF